MTDALAEVPVEAVDAEGLGDFEPDEVEFCGLVAAVTGAEALVARFAKMTFNALNSCPNPVFPSCFDFVQSKPQVVLLSPPEQDAAAPFAEACR